MGQSAGHITIDDQRRLCIRTAGQPTRRRARLSILKRRARLIKWSMLMVATLGLLVAEVRETKAESFINPPEKLWSPPG
jgi:hypothetical protein